jgi:Flp pilus assembly protein TadD
VNQPIIRSVSFFRRSLGHVCGLSLLMLVGCAGSDMVTYSRDAQRAGVKQYNEGNFAEAAGAFKNAARQNPRDYRNYYYLGASYEQMGQWQQAVHAYKTSRSIINISMAGKDDSDFRMRIINGLGRSIARSDLSDAELNAAVSEAEQRASGESWFVVAKIHAFGGDADSALDAYNRASLLEPNNFLILKDYGLYLEQLGQSQKATVPLRRAFALNNQDEQVLQALRRSGVIPGPSLKDEAALVRPTLPKGPIPEVEVNLNFLGGGNGNGRGGASDSTVEAPLD